MRVATVAWVLLAGCLVCGQTNSPYPEALAGQHLLLEKGDRFELTGGNTRDPESVFRERPDRTFEFVQAPGDGKQLRVLAGKTSTRLILERPVQVHPFTSFAFQYSARAGERYGKPLRIQLMLCDEARTPIRNIEHAVTPPPGPNSPWKRGELKFSSQRSEKFVKLTIFSPAEEGASLWLKELAVVQLSAAGAGRPAGKRLFAASEWTGGDSGRLGPLEAGAAFLRIEGRLHWIDFRGAANLAVEWFAKAGSEAFARDVYELTPVDLLPGPGRGLRAEWKRCGPYLHRCLTQGLDYFEHAGSAQRSEPVDVELRIPPGAERCRLILRREGSQGVLKLSGLVVNSEPE